MQYVLTSNEMSKIDMKTSKELGVDSFTLMERASLETAHFIMNSFDNTINIAIFAGIGNNGGDGLALARILWEYDYYSDIYIVGDLSKASELVNKQLSILKHLPLKIYNSLPENNEKYDLAIDSIFGIGLNREISGLYNEVITYINEMPCQKLAIDIPSGINADNGSIMGNAVKCNYTITYAAIKQGQILYPGREYCGELICKKIGIPVNLFTNPNSFIYEKNDIKLPERSAFGNKGTFGKVLLIAGSKNMGGAAILSAKSILRSGAGMVKILTVPENRDLILSTIPEAMISTYSDIASFESLYKESLEWCDCVAIGPGLSINSLSTEVVSNTIAYLNKPAVFDADALNIIAEHDYLMKQIKEKKTDIIFTPHMGEFSRLTKESISKLKEDIINVSREFANTNNIILCCKDACTVVTDGKSAFLNTTGNDGMATAGSGDVLTGIISGLLAQKMSAFEAASMGVYLHGMAGDIAKNKASAYYIIANDIIDSLANIF